MCFVKYWQYIGQLCSLIIHLSLVVLVWSSGMIKFGLWDGHTVCLEMTQLLNVLVWRGCCGRLGAFLLKISVSWGIFIGPCVECFNDSWMFQVSVQEPMSFIWTGMSVVWRTVGGFLFSKLWKPLPISKKVYSVEFVIAIYSTA